MSDLDLTPFFTTKSQAGDFYSRLSKISELCFKTGFDLEKNLINELGLQKKEKLISLMNNNKIQTASNSELKTFIAKILEQITNTPVISLTLAFEPGENTLRNLIEWFMLNINSQVILDITIDHRLVAGTVIKFKGKFFDLSVRSRLDEIINNKLTKPPDISPPPPAPSDINKTNNIIKTQQSGNEAIIQPDQSVSAQFNSAPV